MVPSAANGELVTLAGKALPGPAGPLRAPLSGAECVWYRSIICRVRRPSTLEAAVRPEVVPMNRFALSDLADYGASGDVEMTPGTSGTDVSSLLPFRVGDESGATVVDPRTTDMDSNVFGINAVVPAPPRSDSAAYYSDELHAEWIIPVGADLLAVGVIGHDAAGRPVLSTRGPDVALVTTKPEQQIVSRSTAATSKSVSLPLGNSRTVVLILGALLVLAVVIAAAVIFG